VIPAWDPQAQFLFPLVIPQMAMLEPSDFKKELRGNLMGPNFL